MLSVVVPVAVLGVSRGRLFGLVLAALAAVIGGLLALRGLWRVVAHYRAVGNAVWVEATIVESELDSVPARSYRSPYRTSWRERFAPAITYRYTHDDVEYESDVVHPGGTRTSADPERIRSIVEEYEQGDRVVAYCDPDDPERSYLTEGRLRSTYVSVLASLCLFLSGALQFVDLGGGLVGPLFELFFPGVFATFGVVLLAFGVRKLLAHRRVAGFVPVNATILESELDSGPEKTSGTYAPAITYQYTYEGVELENDDVHPGGTWATGNEERMKAIVDEYRPGDRVTAYCDPEDPTRAYLRDGKLWHAYLTVGAGTVLILVCAAIGATVVL